MARIDTFTGLSEFLAVAEHASFRVAAAELRVTPGAVSQAIRSLETRVGLRLFQRTTRSVALTEAGTALLTRLRPAATEIDEALAALASLRQRPIGHLRLSVPRIALALVIEPVLTEFRAVHPDVSVEIDVDDLNVDLAAGRFDAGIRVGSLIERDMIAVKLTRDCRWLVVGAPASREMSVCRKTSSTTNASAIVFPPRARFSAGSSPMAAANSTLIRAAA
jgi:DNA-binding transcriptional LysR family regulator